MQDFMHLLILRAEYDGGLHNDPPPGHYKSYPDSAGLSAITATMGRLQNAEYIYLNSENTGVAISSEATITRIGIATNAPSATVAAVTAVMIAKIGFTAMDAVQRAVTTAAALTPML